MKIRLEFCKGNIECKRCEISHPTCSRDSWLDNGFLPYGSTELAEVRIDNVGN
ncbi:MAG: hypothetical protein JW787_04600 [Sedimentisphaerales bacterium]|nr:hypothetical protein [Sedimentisphaerales bacterium]